MLAPENESDEMSKSKLPDVVKAGKWWGWMYTSGAVQGYEQAAGSWD